jgi:hypothetical protein
MGEEEHPAAVRARVAYGDGVTGEIMALAVDRVEAGMVAFDESAKVSKTMSGLPGLLDEQVACPSRRQTDERGDEKQRAKLFADFKAELGTRAELMGAIVLLVVLDGLSMQALLVAVLTFGALTVVFDVAYYSYVPHVVPRDLLVAANSRLQATYSIGQMGGPSAAGALVQTVGAAATRLVNVGHFRGTGRPWVHETR